MKTKLEILDSIVEVAKKYDAKIILGKENGITWLTMYGGLIHPDRYYDITKSLSEKTQVDCYFHCVKKNEIQIAIDAELDCIMTEYEYIPVEDEDIPESYGKEIMEPYGMLIK